MRKKIWLIKFLKSKPVGQILLNFAGFNKCSMYTCLYGIIIKEEIEYQKSRRDNYLLYLFPKIGGERSYKDTIEFYQIGIPYDRDTNNVILILK